MTIPPTTSALPDAITLPKPADHPLASSLHLRAAVTWRVPGGNAPEQTTELHPTAPWITRPDGSFRALLQGGPFEVVIDNDPAEAFAVLQVVVRLQPGTEPLRLLDWHWDISGIDPALDRVWHMNFNCWGQPGIIPRANLGRDTEHPPANRLAFLQSADQHGFTFSYALPAAWVHVATTLQQGAWRFTTQIDADIDPENPWQNDPLAIGFGPVTENLGGPRSFHVSRRHPIDVPKHGAWNSWDYYKDNITAQIIRENMRAIQADPVLRSFIKYIVIDDGWQTMDGDWEANEKFPDGMAALAHEIREAGFIPGIWSAPFIVSSRHHIYHEHPDWFVQYDGKPLSPFANKNCTGLWGERYFLDPSHPAVGEHLHNLYSKIRGWGFGYFKTDFLTNSYHPNLSEPLPDRGLVNSYHDHRHGLLRAHRRCMEIMRQAMGPESFWLGCGSIWATGAGLMDASRTTGDIAPTWQALTKCASTAFFNGHTHGRLFLNDPDFLVVRGSQTTRPGMLDEADQEVVTATPGKWRSGPKFSALEARIWASLVVLSGGIITLSDAVPALNDVGLDIVHRLIQVAQHSPCLPAYPLDIHQELPTAALRHGADTPLLGLFNWSDSEQVALTTSLPADLQSVRWRDVWTDREWNGTELASTRIPPHSCLLLSPVVP